MGITYDGPYADQVGHEHEGYLLAGSTIDPSLTGWVAACQCGWHDCIAYPATSNGEAMAETAWTRNHLQPLIEQARRSWPDWAEQVGRRARYIAKLVADGRFSDAVDEFERFDAVVGVWRRTAQELADQ